LYNGVDVIHNEDGRDDEDERDGGDVRGDVDAKGGVGGMREILLKLDVYYDGLAWV
jgi:hypothetical protein